MKIISQNYKTGRIRIEDTRAPALKAGGILVRTRYSLISAGTEGMKVREGKMSLVEKARARPDQVKKVLQSVQQQGLAATLTKVWNKLDTLTPLGYSLAGIVTAVGADAAEFRVGQAVACAGAGYANHAEENYIPRNLAAAVPDGVTLPQAAFATVGAIALQGFRQAQMQLGETACVIGLGLIGQLLAQILRAAGMTVIGLDLAADRCALAVALGAAAAFQPDDAGLPDAVRRLGGGLGADVIFITAAGDTNAPVELAARLGRDRARVVDIGKTRLDLPWKEYYEKEMEVRFSRSYGPGRYDPNYEERGVDYPAGYVRWTEQRNLAAFLQLVARGQVRLDPLIAAIHPFDRAEAVFDALAAGGTAGPGILFEYPPANPAPVRPAPPPAPTAAAGRPPIQGPVRFGVIGAGNYASTMLLPHLAARNDARLIAVCTATALSGANARRKFPFERAESDYSAVLAAPDIDAVLIATRHAAHATMTAAALRAGKAVFVEKPLALDRAGLEQVREAAAASGNDRLQVGFNRRFAPLIRQAADFFRTRAGPLVMNYRVHAGQLDRNSWYLDPAEGSRFIGEAGHFLDVFAFLTGARPVTVFAAAPQPAQPTPDDAENLAVTVSYSDGSVGNLLYLTQGGGKTPKEWLEIFGGGRTAQLDNFAGLSLFDGSSRRRVRARGVDKGQRGELAAFIGAVQSGGAMPIALDSLLDTTLATLAAAESARSGRPVPLAEMWSGI